MDSATSKRNSSFLIWGGVVLVLWLGLYFLNTWLLQQGFSSELAIYYGEQVKLAFHGESSLHHVLFTFPFINYFFFILFQNPMVALAFEGAIIWTSIFYMIHKLWNENQISLPLAITLFIYFLACPSVIVTVALLPVQGTLFLLLAWATFYLRRYYSERNSSYLLLFGIIAAFLIQSSFVRWYIFLLFLPALVTIIHSQRRPYFALLLLIVFPALFFEVATVTLHALLQDEICWLCPPKIPFALLLENTPWHLTSASTTDFELLAATGHWWKSIVYFAQQCVVLFLPMLPYWILWIRIPKYASITTVMFLMIVPLFFILIRIYLGIYTPSAFYALLPVFFSVLFLSKSFGVRFEQHRSLTWILIAAYVISFIATTYQAIHSPFAIERNFMHAVLGKTVEPNLHYAQEAATLLKDGKNVLIDDRVNYKVVYFANDPSRFIIPSHNNFATSLAMPSQYADYVVVSKYAAFDAIAKAHPDALSGKLEGFHLVKDSPDLLIFSKYKN